MFSLPNYKKFIYILSNLFVLPATFIPSIDFLANLSFLASLFLLFKTNTLLFILVCIIFVLKNNANYRFNLLLKLKGDDLSKSDPQCVYSYAWCTLLRYFLIGVAAKEIFQLFK
tara:strand:+ start:437 stop:778 length:342 start_codon:yes stop_codon:yes gene_type:complete